MDLYLRSYFSSIEHTHPLLSLYFGLYEATVWREECGHAPTFFLIKYLQLWLTFTAVKCFLKLRLRTWWENRVWRFILTLALCQDRSNINLKNLDSACIPLSFSLNLFLFLLGIWFCCFYQYVNHGNCVWFFLSSVLHRKTIIHFSRYIYPVHGIF